MSYRIAKRASAVVTSFVALVSYLLTMPPGITFWRPSELAAAASVLGLPEPPASPLWLVIARLAQLAIPFEDVATAAGLLSAVSSAATAGVVVLIVCALVERWFDPSERDRVALPAIGGGVIAGLSFAWADSQWRSATTISIEPLAVLLVAAATLLTLQWSASADEHGHARLLLLAAFALGLLAGVDPRLVVIAPALGAIVFLRAVRATPASVAAAIVVAAVGGWLFDRLATAWIASLLDASNWFIILGIPVLLVVMLTAWSAAADDDHGNVSRIAASACALALIGASVVLVIPIRGRSLPPTNAYSAMYDEPVGRTVGIDDESNAPLWPRRWSIDPERRRFQDRYGSWAIDSAGYEIEASAGAELRFLWRYQISHMYLRYLMWNFVGRSDDSPEATATWFDAESVPDESTVSPALDELFPIRFHALPFLLALIGFAAHLRRDARMATALALLFILSGVGVAIAISLQQPQPRERDMLYLASYLAVAIWIGVGAAALSSRVKRDDDERSEVGSEDDASTTTNVIGATAMLLCLAAAPINLLLGGWATHDRSGSMVAEDYAYNLLQSCDSNAVLLTAGDNDTFPLLYLQDARAVRRDVRIVNLRMANDPAYLIRVSREHRWDSAPLGLAVADSLERGTASADVEVGLPPTVSIDTAGTTSIEGDTVARAMMTWVVRGPALAGEGMHMIRLQERVVVDLLRGNRWRRPIYFSASVASADRAGLDGFLRREGLALRVTPKRQERRGADAVDTALLRAALLRTDGERRFRLDGFSDPQTYLDAEERRIVSVYRHLFLLLAEQEGAVPGSGASVREVLDAMERRIPSTVHPMPYWMSAGIASLYWRAGDRDEAQRAAKRAIDAVDRLGEQWRRHPHARIYHPVQIKAQMLALLNDYDRAIEAYRGLQSKYPTDPHLRGQLEELRVARYLSKLDTAGAIVEIERIVAGYAGVTEPALLNNKVAFEELASELRGRGDSSARR